MLWRETSRRFYVTSCLTFGLWFERFVIEIYKRMENEVHQDQVVTLGMVHKLADRLERDFLEGFVDQVIFILAALWGNEAF